MSWSRLSGMLALAGLLAGCRQIVGIEDREAASTDAAADARADVGSNACTACLQAKCSSELNACAADPACSEYSKCETACVGTAAERDDCRQQCALKSSPAVSTLNFAREVCEATRCADACNAGCGVHVIPTFLAASASACAKCLRESCCANSAECAANTDCTALHHCWDEAYTPESSEVCAATHPEGLTLYNEKIDGCLGGACLAPCGIGSEYSCLGSRHFRWAKAPEIAVSLQIMNGFSRSAIAKTIRVRVCRPSDPACTDPIHDLPTNEMGYVTFKLAPGDANVFLTLEDPGAAYRKTLWIRNAPFDAADVKISAGMMPETTLSSLLALADVSELADRGIVYVEAWDCIANRARESTRKEETGAIDATAVAFRNLDSGAVKGDGPSNNGTGGWLNVKQGSINVSSFAPNGKKIGSATVPVRAGFVTEIEIYSGSL